MSQLETAPTSLFCARSAVVRSPPTHVRPDEMKDEIRFWLYVARALGQAALEREGDAIWLTGKEKHTGEPLSVFYYGRLMAYDYLVQRLYAEHAITRIEEDVSIRAGMRLLEHETASDLVIGDLSWPYYRGLPRTRFLLVPPVIAHTISLPESWAHVEARFRERKTTRDEVRKIDKHGLSYRTGNDSAAIERFYETMYVPYATQRHGSLLDVDSLQDVMAAANAGTLLEVMQRERVLAAGVLHRVGKTMRFLWLGIVDGLDPGLQGAASAALYCFAIQFAIAERCTKLNLMYSPADLNNGIHRYKRKLGARISGERVAGRLAVTVANLTPATIAVFSHMPLAVAGTGGRLNGRIMVAADGLSPEDVRRVGAYYACDGLERLTIFSTKPLSDEVMRTDYAALDAQLPPLELRDLTKSSGPAADFCRV